MRMAPLIACYNDRSEWLVTVGNAPACQACGSEHHELTREPVWPAMWRWLRAGAPFRLLVQRCRDCGAVSDSNVSAAVLRQHSAAVGWIHRLRHARSFIPAPLVYVAAAACGAAWGRVVRARVWQAALVPPLAVWAASMASGLATTSGRRRVRDPEGEARYLAAAGLPLLGLDTTWPGIRRLGGYAEGPEGVRGVTLRHEDGSRLVEVTTAFDEPGWLGPVEVPTAEERTLLGRFLAPGADPDAILQRHQKLEAIRRAASLPPESSVTLAVDGEAVLWRLWRREGEQDWVARAQLTDVAAEVHGFAVAPTEIALVTLTDLDAYAAGERQLRSTRSL